MKKGTKIAIGMGAGALLYTLWRSAVRARVAAYLIQTGTEPEDAVLWVAESVPFWSLAGPAHFVAVARGIA